MATSKTEPAHGAAVNDPRPTEGPEWLGIGGVALAVRDLARVEAFYREVIGLEVVGREDNAVHLGAAGTTFLDLVHRPDALPDDSASAGLFHTAVLLPSRADLGRWLAHSGALRQPLDGAADHLVSEAVYLSDPEGNGVEIYADRPRDQWRWSGGAAGERRVEMANRPLDAEGLLREAGGAPWAGAPEGTRIGHVHLRVGDAAEARRFYGDVLGMDLTAAWPGAAFFSSGGYHHHLAANTWRSAGAGPRDPRRAGLAWVTLEVSGEHAPADIVRHGGEADPAGHSLHDPWGTTLQFRAAAQPTPPPNLTEQQEV
jgi:catechol 2,3-dioxygenase